MDELGEISSSVSKEPSQMTKSQEDIGQENLAFKAAKKIYRPDGWLASEGLFYGCNPDQHDACAQYIMKQHFATLLHDIQENTSSKQFSTVRRALMELGYAQLNHNSLILPRRSLTPKQLELLNAAGIHIPVELNDTSLLNKLEGFQNSLKDGQLNNYQRDLIRTFIENNLFLNVDDDSAPAYTLFDVLSKDLEVIPIRGKVDHQEDWFFAYPEDKSLVVYLNHHRHDGGSEGLNTSDMVKIIPYEEALKICPELEPEKEEESDESDYKFQSIDTALEEIDDLKESEIMYRDTLDSNDTSVQIKNILTREQRHLKDWEMYYSIPIDALLAIRETKLASKDINSAAEINVVILSRSLPTTMKLNIISDNGKFDTMTFNQLYALYAAALSNRHTKMTEEMDQGVYNLIILEQLNKINRINDLEAVEDMQHKCEKFIVEYKKLNAKPPTIKELKAWIENIQ